MRNPEAFFYLIGLITIPLTLLFLGICIVLISSFIETRFSLVPYWLLRDKLELKIKPTYLNFSIYFIQEWWKNFWNSEIGEITSIMLKLKDGNFVTFKKGRWGKPNVSSQSF